LSSLTLDIVPDLKCDEYFALLIYTIIRNFFIFSTNSYMRP
jgi:hypothetical protein